MRAPPGKLWRGCAVLAFLAACERDPLDVACPEVAPEELVVTELRGEQDGEDVVGEWIELFNRSGQTIDLVGLKVRLSTLDGGRRDEFTVRTSLEVPPDGYVTLGRFSAGEEPAHVDYGYASELDRALNTTGAVELFGCGGLEVDQMIYRDLPTLGTLALDGAVAPPDARANDSEDNFCIDAAGAGEGTPQMENPPCS